MTKVILRCTVNQSSRGAKKKEREREQSFPDGDLLGREGIVPPDDVLLTGQM